MSGGLSGWSAALKGNSSKHVMRTNEGAAVYLDSIREMVRLNFVDYAFFCSGRRLWILQQYCLAWRQLRKENFRAIVV